ncbi:MAG: GNAT family N-acetyltransferase [Bacilli bacterium]|nr:GNAT family N-acetyltransferase [Bacilli bacterium]
MEIKKFNKLNEEELNKIINKHYSHWSKYSPLMTFNDTVDKIKNVYTSDKLPYGIAMIENNDIIGFCMLKEFDLNEYPDITPNICNIMIFDEYRHQGYGTKLVEYAKKELKKLGYNRAYLWTDKAPKFYEKIGFTYVKDVIKNDKTGYGRLYMINI